MRQALETELRDIIRFGDSVSDRQPALLHEGAEHRSVRAAENQVQNMNPMRMSYHFGKLMRERRHGGIILVGSGACYGGATGMAVYAGTKAFDLCFGEGLWAELRPHGVDVLNLILGRTNTPMFRAFMEKRGLKVGEGVAEPDDVAKLGLERLPSGPVQNWGAADDQQGFAPISAAARRERILRIEAASNNLFKAK